MEKGKVPALLKLHHCLVKVSEINFLGFSAKINTGPTLSFSIGCKAMQASPA